MSKKFFLLAIIIVFLASCEAQQDGLNQENQQIPSTGSTADIIAPVAGNSGIISIALIYAGFHLSWITATDDTDSSMVLKYRVYISDTHTLSSVEDISVYGVSMSDWLENITSYALPNFQFGKTYHFNILVKDMAGNVTLYESGQVQITHGNQAPIANAGGPYYAARYATGVSTVTLDAYRSYDVNLPNDSIVKFEWDINGDGLFGDLEGVEVQLTDGNWNVGVSIPVAVKVYDQLNVTNIHSTAIQIISSEQMPAGIKILAPQAGALLSGTNAPVQIRYNHPDLAEEKGLTFVFTLLPNDVDITLVSTEGNSFSSATAPIAGTWVNQSLLFDTTSFDNKLNYYQLRIVVKVNDIETMTISKPFSINNP